MGRILAIDYGIKRTGLAVSDETATFAFALDTVPTLKLHEYLLNYFQMNVVDAVVVGEPKKLNNEPTDATPHVEGFIRRLKKDFADLKIFRVDERFTSSMATQAIFDSGLKKQDRKNKALIDQVSATIILQSWIAQQNR